ncbi:MAG: hypothetical protein AB7O65_13860 [Candidatus Korobacteraceae bacterium]
MQRKIASLFESVPVEKDGRVLVQSTCTLCSFVLVGSVSEDLLQQQERHIEDSHSAASPAKAGD